MRVCCLVSVTSPDSKPDVCIVLSVAHEVILFAMALAYLHGQTWQQAAVLSKLCDKAWCLESKRGVSCSQQHFLLQKLLQLLLLHSGGVDGQVASFDLTTGEQVSSFRAATDTVNGLQFHPYLPLAATASGRPPTLLCFVSHLSTCFWVHALCLVHGHDDLL